MTEVISTEVIHAEADAVAGLGLLWGRLQSAMPWMTEVIPTRGSHLPHESFMPMLQTVFGSCGVDFSRPWQTEVCPTGESITTRECMAPSKWP
jgi:hypothetical protein